MSDPKTSAMTAAQAAKAVRRPVLVPPKKAGEQPTVEMRPVREADVLSFKDYGSHVVVVTTDGQKFSSADQAAAAEA